MIPPDDLRARILGAAEGAPSPDRAATVRRDRALAALGVGVLVAVFAVLGGVHVGRRPQAFLLLTSGGWAVVAGLATWSSLGRGRSMLGRPRAWLSAAAIATAPVLVAWALVAIAAWPEVRELRGGASAHVACFVLTLLLAAGPCVAWAWARRGTDPVHPRAALAALGAAAGAWASVSIDLHCELSHEAHVAVGHVLPVAILTLLGAAFGNRVLGLRT